MQDSIVKSPLVTLIQQRSAAVARLQQSMQIPFSEELARQADEVIRQTQEAANETIREDEEETRRHRRRNQQRRHASPGGADDSEADETNDDTDLEGPHRIDITV